MASEGEESGYEDDSSHEYPSDSVSYEEPETHSEDELSDASPLRSVASVRESSGCECGCLDDKDAEVASLLQSLSKMTKRERLSSLMTALSVAEAATTSTRRAHTVERRRFGYILPVVGTVCRKAFASCYDVGDASLTRYRRLLDTGDIVLPRHRGAANKNASKIDTNMIRDWLEGVARTVGEIVPIKTRKSRKKDGRTVNYYTEQPFTLLPSYLTWERLYDDYVRFYDAIEDTDPDCRPGYTSFFQNAHASCPSIRIRSARSNVCDECSVFKMRINHMSNSEDSELRGREFGEHVENARAMRDQYTRDREEAVGTKFVVTMDFSQNLTLPNDPQTPSAWYFLSLISVFVFGVHLANDNRQRNFVYSERKGGKGSNEVISMVHHFLREEEIIPKQPPGENTLVLYADNCTGQNKNNAVMMYCRWLVDAGFLAEANVKFFVKGHTKNSCDRAFGQIKRKYNRNECWTVAQAGDLVQASATSNDCVLLEKELEPFKNFKSSLYSLYKDLPLIKKFQLFRMPKASPGVIECRVKPQGKIELHCIHHRKTSATDTAALVDLLTALQPVHSPPTNPEKISDIHKKILPFVPEAFRGDSIYRAPSTTEEKAAAEIKKGRKRKPSSAHAARKKKPQKQVHEDEGKEAVV